MLQHFGSSALTLWSQGKLVFMSGVAEGGAPCCGVLWYKRKQMYFVGKKFFCPTKVKQGKTNL